MNNRIARMSLTVLVVLALMLAFTSFALAFDSGGNPGETGENTITWTGQGVTNGELEKVLCPSTDELPQGIDPNSYLHFVLTTDGGSVIADDTTPILTLGGSGSGDHLWFKQGGGMLHFYVPYSDLNTLTAYATINVYETGHGAWNLTISHGCPGVSPQDLTVSKTAEPSYTRTYDWTIDKSADKPIVYSVGGGESEAVNYTIAVTRDAGTDSDWAVSGTITIHNPNNFEVLDVTVIDDDCTVTGSPLNVPAGGDATADYVCTFTENPVSGTNTATATWADFGSPNTSASGSADYTFGEPTRLVNDEIDVTDTNGGKWHFTDSGSETYQGTYTDPAGTCTPHENIATIDQTGATDAVTVEDCQGADLTVTKTATPTFTRTYAWDISKDVDKTLVKQIGGTATFNYTVDAWQTGFSDSDWALNGTITVTNPNDWEDVTVTLSDSLSECTLESTEVTVPASGSVDVNYACTFASGAGGTNTATAEWDKVAYYTPSDSASGSADYAFVTPTKLVDQIVTITDTFDGVTTTLGTLTATDQTPWASATYTYSHTVNVPTWNCKTYDNKAEIYETGQYDVESVKVCGPIKTGALTMGFWQNKNGQAIIKGQAIFGVCPSTAWLRQFAPFQDLSASATCAQVGTYVTKIIKAANAAGATMNKMLKGQMLATALDVYFSDPALGGNKINAPTAIGSIEIDLTMICKDMTCSAFEDSSSVFDGTPKTVLEMLVYAASQSDVGGTMWYGNVKFTQELAKDAFDAINNEKVFAP